MLAWEYLEARGASRARAPPAIYIFFG